MDEKEPIMRCQTGSYCTDPSAGQGEVNVFQKQKYGYVARTVSRGAKFK